jgi:hypothetical protein
VLFAVDCSTTNYARCLKMHSRKVQESESPEVGVTTCDKMPVAQERSKAR